MDSLFLEITVIIALASILSLIFRIFRQPEILAYILTGILIGPLGLLQLNNHSFFTAMGDLGVTLLLFMIGLEIKIKDLTSVGKTTLILGPAQIILSVIASYVISLAFGFPILSSLFIGFALAFSSTIIIIKILSDKRELHSLYAKMSVGTLLIQDFVAILFLIFLSAIGNSSGQSILTQLGLIGLKAAIMFAAIIFLSQKIFPKVIEYVAKSQEVLFLLSIAWVFGLAAIVSSKYIGFSIEIGGFLAGLALANSVANYQIIAKVKILRDFFIVIFFVLLGMQMTFNNIMPILIPAIVFSFFVLIGKPLIVMLIMGDMGYKKRTSFLTGLSLSQISEFSLILIFMGSKLGHVTPQVVSLMTLVGITTFICSSYLMVNSKFLYRVFGKYLSVFENKHNHKEDTLQAVEEMDHLKDHVVLVGGDQMGLSIIEALEDLDTDVVVIDFDPNVVKNLQSKKVHKLFGDIADLDIQERAKLDSAKLVISTIPDLEDNLLLLKELQHENRKAKVVVMAMEAHEAKTLYKAGADYVVLPYLAGGRQVVKLLYDNLEKMGDLKLKDKEYIK
ncbi:cation:proton antiporter [Patescibacteria group bacterium]|nr:cation:proton antiporter [Patescibacteria group bacterium]